MPAQAESAEGGNGRAAVFAAGTLYAVLAVVVAAITWLHSHDDAYITYVFARSFAEGLGLSWNGAPGLGTTSPLLAVTLGTLEKIVPLSVPVWGHLLAWTAIFTTAVFAFLLGRREGWPRAGFLVGLGWLVTPATVDFLGGEYPIAVFAVTSAALAASHRHPLWLAASLALAVGLRNEMALAAILLALAVLVRDGWARTLRWLVPGAAGALVLWGGWLLTLRALAGTALPSTLEAKRAQADSPFPFWDGGAKFLSKSWDSAERFFYPAGVWIFVTLAVLGVVALIFAHLRSARESALTGALVLWGPVHLLALASIDVPYYPWYSVPLHFSILVLVARTVELVAGRPEKDSAGRARLGLAATLALAVLLLVNGALNLRRHTGRTEDPRETTYRGLSEWISERYPPETRVASFEVGYMGYHGRFQTLDLLGLTTPQTPFDAVREGDFPRVVRVLEPDLLLWPQPFVELGRALLGDGRDFFARFELEKAHTRTWPPVLIYRRRELAPRGDVILDLLARGGGGEFRAKRRIGAPTAVLAPGDARRFEIPAGTGGELVLSLAPGRQPPAVARLRLLDGDVEVAGLDLRQDEPRWLGFTQQLPARDGESVLELRCALESAGPCLFAAPHVRRGNG